MSVRTVSSLNSAACCLAESDLTDNFLAPQGREAGQASRPSPVKFELTITDQRNWF
jgi:hypothetical protein